MKYKIKDFGKIITGTTPSTKNKDYYNESKYMFIGPTDLKGVRHIVSSEKHISECALSDYSNRELNKNDIVVDCIGSDMGDVAVITKKCMSNQQINAITNINYNIVLPIYLYYLLSTKKSFFHLIGSNGSTMPIISKSLFENIEFDIHELSIQQHIVDTIGSIDDLIEKNDKIILKAHKLIDNIYLKETNNLELVKISELDYFNISKSGIKKFENNKIYLDTSAVSDINITDESYIIEYGNRPSRANMQPKENTIWFAKLKDSPKYILVKNQKRLLENFIFSTGFMGLESEKYIVNYLYALILSVSFTNQKNLLSNGATMQGINNEIFMNILVPNADKTMAKLIGEKLENYVNLICRLQEKNYKLKHIKETLLQKYFG